MILTKFVTFYKKPFICFILPHEGIEMNGKYKFYALWTCGCVLSERAFKEAASENCHSCGAKFEKDDIIIINAEGEDLSQMEKNMEARREKIKKIRKEKKDKKNSEKRKAEAADPFAVPCGLPSNFKSDTGSDAKKPKLSKDIDKKEKSTKSKSKDKPSKKASSATSVPDKDKIDVKHSKVYKSLFASSENKNHKDKQSHWVTYNPYHL